MLQHLNELGLLHVLIDLVSGEISRVHSLVSRTSFDFLQDLFLSLDLEYHLHVDVLNVEVLLRDHQRSGIRMQVVERVVSSWTRRTTQVLPSIVQAQAVVPAICLLERVNGVGLDVLSLACFWQTAL